MSTTRFELPPGVARFGRKTGYSIVIVINLVMLIVVQNIVAWDLLTWLTDDFSQLVPWISFSLVASIAVNVVYEFNDTPTVKAMGQIGTNLIAIVVTSQILGVFPFDFSAYSFNWEIVARIVLILALVGSGIGIITETIELAANGRPNERR